MAKKSENVVVKYLGFREDPQTGMPAEFEVPAFTPGDLPKKKHIMRFEIMQDQTGEFETGTEASAFTPTTFVMDSADRCKLVRWMNILLPDDEVEMPEGASFEQRRQLKREYSKRAIGGLAVVKAKQIQTVNKTTRNGDPITYHNIKGDINEYQGHAVFNERTTEDYKDEDYKESENKSAPATDSQLSDIGF